MSENNEQEKVEMNPPLPVDKASVHLKLVMALLVGLVTAAVGAFAGIYSLRQPESWVCLPQRQTVYPQMRVLASYLNKYKEEHGTYPLTLEEMTSQWKDHEGKPRDIRSIKYEIQDGWENLLIYSSDGETWELLSYGADGKPGGIGLDTDIRCTDSTEDDKLTKFNRYLYKDAKPTIEQVIRSKRIEPTVVFSGLLGLIFAFHHLFLSKKQPDNKRDKIIAEAIALVIATSIFAAGYAFFQSIANSH